LENHLNWCTLSSNNSIQYKAKAKASC